MRTKDATNAANAQRLPDNSTRQIDAADVRDSIAETTNYAGDVETKVNASRTIIDDLSPRLTTAEGAITGLTTTLGTTTQTANDALAKANQNQTDLANYIANNPGGGGGGGTDLTMLTGIVTGHTEDIRLIRGRLDTLETDRDTHDTAIQTNKEAITALETASTTQGNAITALQTADTNFTTRLNGIEVATTNYRTAANQRLSNAETAITGLTGRVETLEASTGGGGGSGITLAEKNQLDAATRGVATNAEAIQAINDELPNIPAASDVGEAQGRIERVPMGDSFRGTADPEFRDRNPGINFQAANGEITLVMPTIAGVGATRLVRCRGGAIYPNVSGVRGNPPSFFYSITQGAHTIVGERQITGEYNEPDFFALAGTNPVVKWRVVYNGEDATVRPNVEAFEVLFDGALHAPVEALIEQHFRRDITALQTASADAITRLDGLDTSITAIQAVDTAQSAHLEQIDGILDNDGIRAISDATLTGVDSETTDATTLNSTLGTGGELFAIPYDAATVGTRTKFTDLMTRYKNLLKVGTITVAEIKDNQIIGYSFQPRVEQVEEDETRYLGVNGRLANPWSQRLGNTAGTAAADSSITFTGDVPAGADVSFDFVARIDGLTPQGRNVVFTSGSGNRLTGTLNTGDNPAVINFEVIRTGNSFLVHITYQDEGNPPNARNLAAFGGYVDITAGYVVSVVTEPEIPEGRNEHVLGDFNGKAVVGLDLGYADGNIRVVTSSQVLDTDFAIPPGSIATLETDNDGRVELYMTTRATDYSPAVLTQLQARVDAGDDFLGLYQRTNHHADVLRFLQQVEVPNGQGVFKNVGDILTTLQDATAGSVEVSRVTALETADADNKRRLTALEADAATHLEWRGTFNDDSGTEYFRNDVVSFTAANGTEYLYVALLDAFEPSDDPDQSPTEWQEIAEISPAYDDAAVRQLITNLTNSNIVRDARLTAVEGRNTTQDGLIQGLRTDLDAIDVPTNAEIDARANARITAALATGGDIATAIAAAGGGGGGTATTAADFADFTTSCLVDGSNRTPAGTGSVIETLRLALNCKGTVPTTGMGKLSGRILIIADEPRTYSDFNGSLINEDFSHFNSFTGTIVSGAGERIQVWEFSGLDWDFSLVPTDIEFDTVWPNTTVFFGGQLVSGTAGSLRTVVEQLATDVVEKDLLPAGQLDVAINQAVQLQDFTREQVATVAGVQDGSRIVPTATYNAGSTPPTGIFEFSGTITMTITSGALLWGGALAVTGSGGSNATATLISGGGTAETVWSFSGVDWDASDPIIRFSLPRGGDGTNYNVSLTGQLERVGKFNEVVNTNTGTTTTDVEPSDLLDHRISQIAQAEGQSFNSTGPTTGRLELQGRVELPTVGTAMLSGRLILEHNTPFTWNAAGFLNNPDLSATQTLVLTAVSGAGTTRQVYDLQDTPWALATPPTQLQLTDLPAGVRFEFGGRLIDGEAGRLREPLEQITEDVIDRELANTGKISEAVAGSVGVADFTDTQLATVDGSGTTSTASTALNVNSLTGSPVTEGGAAFRGQITIRNTRAVPTWSGALTVAPTSASALTAQALTATLVEGEGAQEQTWAFEGYNWNFADGAHTLRVTGLSAGATFDVTGQLSRVGRFNPAITEVVQQVVSNSPTGELPPFTPQSPYFYHRKYAQDVSNQVAMPLDTNFIANQNVAEYQARTTSDKTVVNRFVFPFVDDANAPVAVLANNSFNTFYEGTFAIYAQIGGALPYWNMTAETRHSVAGSSAPDIVSTRSVPVRVFGNNLTAVPLPGFNSHVSLTDEAVAMFGAAETIRIRIRFLLDVYSSVSVNSAQGMVFSSPVNRPTGGSAGFSFIESGVSFLQAGNVLVPSQQDE